MRPISTQKRRISTQKKRIFTHKIQAFGAVHLCQKKKSSVRKEGFYIVFVWKESSSNIEVAFVSKENSSSTDITDMEWLRLVGSIKL